MNERSGYVDAPMQAEETVADVLNQAFATLVGVQARLDGMTDMPNDPGLSKSGQSGPLSLPQIARAMREQANHIDNSLMAIANRLGARV